MINAFAHGLEVGHPAAFLLMFMLIGIPLLYIILVGISLIKNKNK